MLEPCTTRVLVPLSGRVRVRPYPGTKISTLNLGLVLIPTVYSCSHAYLLGTAVLVRGVHRTAAQLFIDIEVLNLKPGGIHI